MKSSSNSVPTVILSAYQKAQEEKKKKSAQKVVTNAVPTGKKDTKSKPVLKRFPIPTLIKNEAVSRELISACKAANALFADKFLVNKADVNYADENLMTPLHWAVKSNSIECVERLLQEKNIAVNRQDIVKWTPLHYAVYLKFQDIVSVLLQVKQINLTLVNNQGKRAQDLPSSKEIKDQFKAYAPKEEKRTFKDLLTAMSDSTTVHNHTNLPDVEILEPVPIPVSTGKLLDSTSSVRLRNEQDNGKFEASTKITRRGRREELFRMSDLDGDEKE